MERRRSRRSNTGGPSVSGIAEADLRAISIWSDLNVPSADLEGAPCSSELRASHSSRPIHFPRMSNASANASGERRSVSDPGPLVIPRDALDPPPTSNIPSSSVTTSAL
eukprot:scaffold33988_cov26-Tisochrysis_lutea.AAC.1